MAHHIALLDSSSEDDLIVMPLLQPILEKDDNCNIQLNIVNLLLLIYII